MSTTKKLDVIGHARRRVDGREKVTGQLRYADDMKLPRMLHMKLLRSPHPHALIEGIDATRARAHPGVHLVLTGKDFPVSFGIMPVAQDEYPLAPEHVRYVGDPVAAVVAKDEQTASEALALIAVKYKALPTIATPEEALAQPEVRIHDYTDSGNIHRNQAFEFGDVEEALAGSDHVFEDLFFYEGDTHLAMEQHASLAKAEGDGKLTIWSSTQDPHYLHRQLARVLQMSAAHIRVIACDNGGGFGGKCDPAGHEFVVSKAALVLGRPVKICLTREEVFYLHRGRHPVLMKFRTGVTKEGKLTGGKGLAADIPLQQWVHFEIIAEIGAATQGRWTLRVTPAGRATQNFSDLPFRSAAMKTLDWVGFISAANEKTEFYLDNLAISTTDPSH